MIPNFLRAVPDSITLLLSIDKCYISGLKHGGGAWLCPRWVSLLPYLLALHLLQRRIRCLLGADSIDANLYSYYLLTWTGLEAAFIPAQIEEAYFQSSWSHFQNLPLKNSQSLGMERIEKSDWGHGTIFQIDPPRQGCMKAAQIHL